MNTGDRLDLEMLLADQLRAGLAETSNPEELAFYIANSLHHSGWEITREPERCHALIEGMGIFGVIRCYRHVAHGGPHDFALSDDPRSPRVIPS